VFASVRFLWIESGLLPSQLLWNRPDLLESTATNRGAQKLNDQASATGASMKTFYAMRRAIGDWIARAVTFDACALEELRRTDGPTASFLMITDPSRHLKHGLRLGFSELAPLMMT
jgi:hypothetical protein